MFPRTGGKRRGFLTVLGYIFTDEQLELIGELETARRVEYVTILLIPACKGRYRSFGEWMYSLFYL